jgi:hypothetical protein
MSVFLRWGIFGILGFAGLMYAYNASKHMAEKRIARGAAAASTPARPAPLAEHRAEAPPAPPPAAATPQCEAELVVAGRALEARRDGEPLDRLLRIQEIVFQEPARRQRLEKVANDWFNLKGAEPIPEELRVAVISDCVRAAP